MGDEYNDNVKILVSYVGDPKNSAFWGQTAQQMKKHNETIVKDAKRATDARLAEEDRLHHRQRDRSRQRAADNKKDLDQNIAAQRKEAREIDNLQKQMTADEGRRMRERINMHVRTEQQISADLGRRLRERAEMHSRHDLMVERNAAVAARRAAIGSGGTSFFGRRNSPISRFGNELRMLPSMPIPGTGFGTDSVANVIRMGGAADQLGGGRLARAGAAIRTGVQTVGIAAGATTFGGSLAAGAGVIAGTVAGIAAAGVSIALWSERLRGSTSALGSFTLKIGNFLAGTNLTAGFGARGSRQSATYNADQATIQKRRTQQLQIQGRTPDDAARIAYDERRETNTSNIAAQMEERRNFNAAQRPFRELANQTDEELYQANKEHSIALAGRGKFGADRSAAENAAAITATRSELNTQRGVFSDPGKSLDEQAAAYARMQAAVKELRNLENERYTVAKEKQSELLQRERDSLALSKEMLSSAKSELTAIRQQLGSNAERFLEADPFERSQIASAARKANAGGQLTYQEAKSLRGFSGFEDQITNSALNELGKYGAAGQAILPPNLVARSRELRDQVSELTVKIQTQDQNIRVIKSTNENELKQIADEVGKVVADLYKQQVDSISAAAAIRARQLIEQEREADDANRRRGATSGT